MERTRITLSINQHVAMVGLNRPEKANAFDMPMFHELSLALAEVDANDDVRVVVLHAHGSHFTGGMDLPAVGPQVQAGASLVAPGGLNPFQTDGRRLSKPLVVAVHGKCLTLGTELVLAGDIAVCAESTTFGQLEPSVGLFPFGGSTYRLPARAGWGNAMRWLLTCDEYGSAEAFRIGLVQEVVPDGEQLDRALGLARRIARHAPLAVAATISNALRAVRDGQAAAEQELYPTAYQIFNTSDGQRGIDTFRSTARPVFDGN